MAWLRSAARRASSSVGRHPDRSDQSACLRCLLRYLRAAVTSLPSPSLFRSMARSRRDGCCHWQQQPRPGVLRPIIHSACRLCQRRRSAGEGGLVGSVEAAWEKQQRTAVGRISRSSGSGKRRERRRWQALQRRLPRRCAMSWLFDTRRAKTALLRRWMEEPISTSDRFASRSCLPCFQRDPLAGSDQYRWEALHSGCAKSNISTAASTALAPPHPHVVLPSQFRPHPSFVRTR